MKREEGAELKATNGHPGTEETRKGMRGESSRLRKAHRVHPPLAAVELSSSELARAGSTRPAVVGGTL